MKISKRLYKLAECVNPGDTVADIGTDHGYVPMLLLRSGISPHVIMSDISEGSLSKAKETFKLTGLTGSVKESDFRVGDGLDTLSEAETDEIIIAGLGGHTIAGILDADVNKSKSFKRIVLQPRKHSGSLRYYLYTHGWVIESEHLAEEGKFACEIITAVPTDMGHIEPPFGEEDIRWKYPPDIIKADPYLALLRIEWKLGSICEQSNNLDHGSNDHSELIDRLRSDHEYLCSLKELAKKSLK